MKNSQIATVACFFLKKKCILLERDLNVSIHISDSLNGSLAVIGILRTVRAIQGGIKAFREKQSFAIIL